MYIIGLTGGIASGKSAVADILRDSEVAVLDADKIAKDISKRGKSGYNAVKAAFGKKYVSDDSIDRKKLGQLVFSDKNSRLKLNSIMLPLIKQEIESILNQINGSVVLDAPLLFEAGLDSICDKIWAVTADEEIRIERIIKRDGLSRDEAYLRISSQKKDEFFIKHADVVIDNSGSKDELHEKVKGLLNEAKIAFQ